MAAPLGGVTIIHNGLRDRITFDKGFPLMHALEQYCAKYGLDPSKYVLSSGKTNVDLGIPFQFSSLPNNCTLELNLREGGADPAAAEVKVAIERGSGPRLEGIFFTKATLADVILSFVRSGDLAGYDDAALLASKFEGVSVVYVRRSVKGAELLTTSLASLGAIKGTAGLRLNMPAPSAASTPTTSAALADTTPACSPVVAAAPSPVAEPLPSFPVAAAANIPATEHAATASVQTVSAPSDPLPVIDEAPNVPIAVTQPPVPADVSIPVHNVFPSPASSSSEVINASKAKRPRTDDGADAPSTMVTRARKAITRLRSVNFDADTKTALLTALKLLDNLIKFPDEAKFRSVKFSNPKFNDALGRHPAAVELLRCIGFADQTHPVTGERAMVLAAPDEDSILTLRDILEPELRSLGAEVPPAPEVDYSARDKALSQQAEAEAAFDPFKTNVTKMNPVAEKLPALAAASASTVAASAAGSGEEAEFMTGTEKRVADLKRRAVELQAAHRPTHRATKVVLFDPESSFRAGVFTAADTAATVGAEEDWDESDPEVQRMLAEYAKKKIAEYNTEKDMKTKAQRELDALQAAKVFTATVIRVEMPDRTVIQGVFSPLDTIQSVHEWLRSLFSASVASLPFYLYSTPPTVEHPASDATLGDLKMSPAKVLRCAWGSGLGSRLLGDDVPTDPAQYLLPEVLDATLAGEHAAQPAHKPAAVDLHAKPSGADVSEEELERMTAMLMQGQNPLTAQSGDSGRAAGGAGAKKPSSSSGKPAWLKL